MAASAWLPGSAKPCEKDKASWAEKCSYDTLHCASCIDCGVPGKPYPYPYPYPYPEPEPEPQPEPKP